MPPFSRSNIEEFANFVSSPNKRLSGSHDNDSEMDDDDIAERDVSERRNGNKNGKSQVHKIKCALCDFETVSHDIYRNHLMLHATKDQDSPPPLLPTTLPSLPQLPQYPLQIRSPLSINSDAKIPSSLIGKNKDLNPKPLPSSNNNDADMPSSSSSLHKDPSKTSEYLEFMKKVAPLLKQGLAPSPSGISSTQTGSPPAIYPPFTTGSTSDLISKLYFGNVFKTLQTSTTSPSSLLPQHPAPLSSSQNQTRTQLPEKPRNDRDEIDGQQAKNEENNPSQTTDNTASADADSSSGALDLTRAQPGLGFPRELDSPAPSRPQSGSQTSTGSSSNKSRRKGKAFKIERKALNAANSEASTADRDSLNSGHSGYSNEQDVDAKSDESGSSGLATKENSGTNGHHPILTLGEETGNGTSAPATDSPMEAKNQSLSGSHVCKFCEIAFMDSVMFTIHMGYHGFQNPYKCNMCGDEFDDRVGFFLHIARKAHQ